MSSPKQSFIRKNKDSPSSIFSSSFDSFLPEAKQSRQRFMAKRQNQNDQSLDGAFRVFGMTIDGVVWHDELLNVHMTGNCCNG